MLKHKKKTFSLSLVLHGERLPMESPYGTGTKSIGLMDGAQLDMHGKKKTKSQPKITIAFCQLGKPLLKSWTLLDGTVQVGATK